MRYRIKFGAVLILLASILLSACTTAVVDKDGEDEKLSSEAGGVSNKITIAVPGISGGFSPFFSGSEGANTVMSVINAPLVTLDRRGEVVTNAADGETRSFNGKDYEYSGIANVDIKLRMDGGLDGATVFSFNLRDDVYFSDGERLTADDLIFTLYVMADVAYNGDAAISSLPIDGIEYYRANADKDTYDKYAEMALDCLDYGADYDGDDEEFEYLEAIGYFSKEQFDLFYECYNEAWLSHVRRIVDYSVINYGDLSEDLGYGDVYSDERLQVALAMRVWRIADFTLITPKSDTSEEVLGPFTSISGKEWDLVSEFPTVRDFYNEFYELYDGDLTAYISAERINDNDDPLDEAKRMFIERSAAVDPDNKGTETISGIRKTDEHSVQVTLQGLCGDAIYSFVIPVVPLHHYGDLDLYDYDNGAFGFKRGDLSAIREKGGQPLGAGPYKIIASGETVAELEANPLYFKGEPKTPYLSFRATAPSDLIYGVAAGMHDIAQVMASENALDEIDFYNSADRTETEVYEILRREALFGPFGYIGINADLVNVDYEPMSDESVNFRKGIATILAACREDNGSAKEQVEVAEYPVTGVSWAAPRPNETGYRPAYSTDLNNSPIYSDGMSKDQRLRAAKTAALGYFEAAGCELSENKTAIEVFPDGVQSRYEVYITDGEAHPSYALLLDAREALGALGISLIIKDVSSQGEMFRAVANNQADMWCAAFANPDSRSAAVTPRLSKTFSSDGEYNFFGLDDPQTDRRIAEAEGYLDLERYKKAFDAVLDGGVIVPVYQREAYYLFSGAIDQSTVETDLTAHYNYINVINEMGVAKG